MGPVEQYLKSMAWMRDQMGPPAGFKYASMEAFVLRHGRPFSSSKPTAEQRAYLRDVARSMRFVMKQCFANAQQLLVTEHMMGGDRLRYAEGWASTGFLPVHHGWLVLDGKILVDPTFKVDGKPRACAAGTSRPGGIASSTIGVLSPSQSYYGVVFPTDVVVDRIRRTGEYATLIDDWSNDYPALKGDYDQMLEKL